MSEKIEPQQTAAMPKQQARKTKAVRNRSGQRIELLIDNKVVVFLPGRITQVPADFRIPSGIGLYER